MFPRRYLRAAAGLKKPPRCSRVSTSCGCKKETRWPVESSLGGEGGLCPLHTSPFRKQRPSRGGPAQVACHQGSFRSLCRKKERCVYPQDGWRSLPRKDCCTCGPPLNFIFADFEKKKDFNKDHLCFCSF